MKASLKTDLDVQKAMNIGVKMANKYLIEKIYPQCDIDILIHIEKLYLNRIARKKRKR
jgi:hypothetical protein